VALIEVPPYAAVDASAAWERSSALHGRLRNADRWLLKTPTELNVEEGLVIEAR
jgi:hypothetical protein